MARRFGYSRVSTSDQDWSLQLEALTKAGVDDRDSEPGAIGINQGHALAPEHFLGSIVPRWTADRDALDGLRVDEAQAWLSPLARPGPRDQSDQHTTGKGSGNADPDDPAERSGLRKGLHHQPPRAAREQPGATVPFSLPVCACPSN